MSRPAANPSFPRRVANVTIVALCTACSLALLGAVPAEWGRGRMYVGTVTRAERRATAVPASEDALAQFTGAVMRPRVYAEIEFRGPPAGADPVALPVSPAAAAPAIRVMRMEITAYCPCRKCCGSHAQGITASGKRVDYNGGKFVAADTRVLPFGKKLVIPGYAEGVPVEVIDRGGAIKGNKLDLYFPTHAEALSWGRQHLDVTVYE